MKLIAQGFIGNATKPLLSDISLELLGGNNCEAH